VPRVGPTGVLRRGVRDRHQRQPGKSAGATEQSRPPSRLEVAVEKHWGAILADFRREYGISPQDIPLLTERTFWDYVVHLSPEAAFWRVAGDEVSVIDDPSQIAAALHT
jgi:hypothetical protein